MNKIGENKEIKRVSLLAHITIAPKEGKNRTICSNYRPKALLNANRKLYEKILTARLLFPELINVYQAGFIPGREGRDNSIRIMLMLRKGKNKGSPAILLSIDVEKAFDGVEWGFSNTWA